MEDPAGVVVKDQIKQKQVRILTDSPIFPIETSIDEFEYPVDIAFSITASRFMLNLHGAPYLRSQDGEYDGPIKIENDLELEENTYTLDLSTPVKVYWKFSGSPRFIQSMDSFHLLFPEPTSIKLGVRTTHKQPEETITVTRDIGDIRTALNFLPSSLKTLLPDRSYPTLRGYPPLIEFGSELDVPESLSKPDTGLKIVVPEDFRYLYPVAPLAFYTGASIEPGRSPRISGPNFEYSLETEQLFEDVVAKILKQFLFLDCILRTEGIYKVNLYERGQIEAKLPFEVSNIYSEPLSTQLKSYLEVDYATIEPHIPRWCLTAHLPSKPKSAEAIPHIVNDLGIIRDTRGKRSEWSRTTENTRSRLSYSRSLARNSERENVTLEVIEPERTDNSVEHAWFGNETPFGASKASIESFQHQLNNVRRSESISITVVCNDARMIDEQASLDGVYGKREGQPFNVDSYFGVSREKLRHILTEKGCDFLHYIGHATPSGLRCNDGELDVRKLDSVSANVFLLNACRSFEQAEALVKKGSFGGVATLGDVVNQHAIEIGQSVANLLNLGFPLRAAVELVHDHTEIGKQYLIVGDGSLDVVQTEDGVPVVFDVSLSDNDRYELIINPFPTKNYQIGSELTPQFSSGNERFLLPGPTCPFEVDKETLLNFLGWTIYPFRMDGELHWNNSLGVDILPE
ncbi:hypothetical protein [Haloarchaeobius sp. DFWS5]|uniref:hypothetical protein n=1 Tax=Haloarchaeobius sp. DFWS5 TaxID=3446114 RepID=UPI003EBDF953